MDPVQPEKNGISSEEEEEVLHAICLVWEDRTARPSGNKWQIS